MKVAFLAQYYKAIIAVGGTLAIVGEAFADGIVSTTEIGVIATSAAAAIGVFAKANKKPPVV